ncbi:hypothetical protein SOVF_131090 isoform A [Spinacia oleracea]|uniref:Uncharacterized protein isoform X2 n=1 Tax=Spinacia oleracea TaxID=3562 RepID=A0A9R0IMC6_SPIOL|nr:uncharacterized protein LOC110791548 isoform X2 [Spinacia oleracea]KNA11870.1 hypothetical protein SOVF_131090 isoform A [Spinacia oleracea]
MGKDGELWDDSALVNAFDEAISKYKKMHKKGYKQNPNTATADVKTSSSDAPTVIDATQELSSNPEKLDEGIDSSSRAIPEVEETKCLETDNKGNEVADSEVPGEHALGSSSLPLQDQSQNYSTSLDMDEYNQLYKQYYEVEEQRQNILQKLQNFSNYYAYESNPSEVPVSGLQWGPHSATQGQEYQSSTCQLPCGTMVVSCCPCACQSSMASCSSLPCPLAGVSASTPCVNSLETNDLKKHPTVEDADIVKTAMGAAEKAISILKNKTSDSKEENKINDAAEQSANSGTDLSIVLNAWYSAGFYTGKYLTEQSLAKKQHD